MDSYQASYFIWTVFDSVTIKKGPSVQVPVDPDPFWIIKLAQEKTTGWVQEVISASLRDEYSNTSLRTQGYVPSLRSHSWTLPCWIIIGQFLFCSSWKRLVRQELQKILGKTDYLDTFYMVSGHGSVQKQVLVACFELFIHIFISHTLLVINNKNILLYIHRLAKTSKNKMYFH